MRRVLLLVPVLLVGLAAPVAADHCPSGQAHPGIKDENMPCEPPGGAATRTPSPEPTPAAEPTAEPAPVATSVPVARTRATPAPTQAPVEVPLSEPEVVVPGPVNFGGEPLEETSQGEAGTWMFGLVVGLLAGLIVGRSSWNWGRRRKRQVFG